MKNDSSRSLSKISINSSNQSSSLLSEEDEELSEELKIRN